MNDVGAFVLTLGERTTGRALTSLRSQTLPIGEVAVISGIRPFHRAFNVGVQRTTTPFVVQVDSDFVLDPECVETLYRGMAPGVGITVAPLRDPLVGAVAGVKLFRRECLASSRLRNTIAPEVDFYRRLERDGWQTRYLLAKRPGSAVHTLGAHRPRATLGYVFGTYYLLGARYVRHNDAMGLLWRLSQLRRSRHLLAPVARLAMGHGMFAHDVRDAPKPTPAKPVASFLREVRGPVDRAAPGSSAEARAAIGTFASLPPRSLLNACLDLGRSLRAGSPAAFRELLCALAESGAAWSWVAEVGLAHGALSTSRSAVPEPTFTTLENIARSRISDLFPRPV